MHYELIHNLKECARYADLISRSQPHWTIQFQSICVGLGALAAGFGGLKIGTDWLQQERLKRKVKALKKKYPLDQLDKDYKLIVTKEAPGKWQLLDSTNRSVHWIKNLDTTRELGWTYDKVKHITNKSIADYRQGEPIDTTSL